MSVEGYFALFAFLLAFIKCCVSTPTCATQLNAVMILSLGEEMNIELTHCMKYEVDEAV